MDEIQPRNELTDLAASLSSIDFVPIRAADSAQDTMVHICYDFPPHASDCPLLLNPPHDLKVDAQAAAVNPKRGQPGHRPGPATPVSPMVTKQNTRSSGLFSSDKERHQSNTPAGRHAPRMGSYLDRGHIGT